MKFSYFDEYESRFFPTAPKCFLVSDFYGLQEQLSSHFFFLEFISTNIPRNISDRPIYNSVIKKLFKIGFYHIRAFAIRMELTLVQVISRFHILMFYYPQFFDSHSSCNAVFTSCASSFSLSSLGKISYIIVSQPFSLHVFAKRICLLAISSGSFFDLKSLVPICRINLSVFRRSVGLM